MRLSFVNSIVLLLVVVVGGWFVMGNQKKIAIIDVERVYQHSHFSEDVKKHLGDVRIALEKGYSEATKTFSDRDNKEELLLDAKRKIEQQYIIETQNANAVFLSAINSAINKWKKKNPSNVVILPSNGTISYSESANVTDEIIDLIKDEKAVFNNLPKVIIKNSDNIENKSDAPVNDNKKH